MFIFNVFQPLPYNVDILLKVACYRKIKKERERRFGFFRIAQQGTELAVSISLPHPSECWDQRMWQAHKAHQQFCYDMNKFRWTMESRNTWQPDTGGCFALGHRCLWTAAEKASRYRELVVKVVTSILMPLGSLS